MPAARKTNKKHPLCALLVCAILVCAATAAANIVCVQTAAPYIVTAEAARGLLAREGGAADCILVLGASVAEDGPSPMLADRLDEGMALYGLGVSNILLLSGDNGTVEYNEVQAMKDYVLKNGGAMGIEPANIYLDYAGFSTYDSAIRCKEIFEAKRVVIVTQRYHLYRAVYNAKKIGLDVYGVAAPDTKHGQFSRDIREVFARAKDFFLTHIGYEPAIMGEPVPLVYPSTQE
ncbi:MAG: YdcF family protein [Clostridiales Family XIII bacterium]|jgi:vancomycin permeability regulator SanA|nr:YdcF family protein [Clostridiales Family XIII bacterium]